MGQKYTAEDVFSNVGTNWSMVAMKKPNSQCTSHMAETLQQRGK